MLLTFEVKKSDSVGNWAAILTTPVMSAVPAGRIFKYKMESTATPSSFALTCQSPSGQMYVAIAAALGSNV